MSDVYLITSGKYSDYTVHAAYSTEEKAEAMLAQFNWGRTDEADEGKIETLPLDTESFGCLLLVFMEKDGRGAQCSKFYGDHPGLLGFYEPITLNYSHVELLSRFGWVVRCNDRESFEDATVRATKAVNEIRTQILALGMWGDTQAVREMFQS